MVLYGRTSQKFAKNFRSMRSLLVCFILSLWFMDGFAKQVTLAWDANTERNAAGYRLYYGLSSRAYTSIRDVGDQTSYTLSDLEEDKTYYFAVTAYNFKQTVESDFSNEVNTSGNNGVRSASQESPSAGSYESGIGIIRGWACNASTIEVEIDGGERMKAAYGTQREDTGSVCGRTDTGYGLTYNWNRLGDGEHTLRVYADGVEFSRVNFHVTTFGTAYLQGISGEYTIPDFPQTGNQLSAYWSEPHQNFIIVNATATATATANNGMAHPNTVVFADRFSSMVASQESPSAGSYESGIGIIRGWACNASTIEVEIDGGERMKAAYGTQREDTGSVCGRTDTGYGLTYNWNRLGDGKHTLRVYADGVEFGRVRFTVTTLGHDYLKDLPIYERTLSNFPTTGKDTTLRWSEAHQNFIIVGVQ